MEKLLTQLKLARIREVYQDWIDKASKEEMSYADFLSGLLTEEICAREESRIDRRMRVVNPQDAVIEEQNDNVRRFALAL